MPERYEELAEDLMALEQEGETLPMARDEWNTRPDTVSYGIVGLDFESSRLIGDNLKQDISHEGSVDLFSLQRGGAGWVQLITQTLTQHCEGSWSLNSHTYERETGLFHWEWVFEV